MAELFRPYQHYVMGRYAPHHAVTPDLVCLSNCLHGDHWPCYCCEKDSIILVLYLN